MNTITKTTKMFTLAAIATATIGLAAPGQAALIRSTAIQTKPTTTVTTTVMSCETALKVAAAYIAAGDVMMATDNVSAAAGYYGKAEGVIEAAC